MGHRIQLGAAVLTLLAAVSSAIGAERAYVGTRSLSMEVANRLAMAAAKACTDQGYQVAAAVVDRGGRLLALVRNPLAGPHTIEVARQKAYTAATFQTPTLELQTRSGMTPLSSVPDVLMLGGGVPVEVGGRFYGGVGVSGAPGRKATGDQDDACARAGIDAVRETLEFAD